MKGGTLDDFKLYYEDVEGASALQRLANKRRKQIAKERVLARDTLIRFASILPYILRQFKATHRSAILNVNDRKTMPKLPQGAKAKRQSKKKRPL